MIGPEIRAIFFDAVGTLLHPHPPAGAVYADVGRRRGSRYAPPEIVHRFRAAFARQEHADRAANLRTSEERERKRWQTIVASVLDDVPDPDACFADLYDHFGQPRAWRCEGDAAGVLDALARRGYRLGMASNYDHRLRSVRAGFPALRRLDPLIISSEVGWRKPAADFFAALCRAVHLPAAALLYVGDDPDSDYAGARAAGLDAVLFDPAGKHASGPQKRIGRLTALL